MPGTVCDGLTARTLWDANEWRAATIRSLLDLIQPIISVEKYIV
jgi:hypothetical protein